MLSLEKLTTLLQSEGCRGIKVLWVLRDPAEMLQVQDEGAKAGTGVRTIITFVLDRSKPTEKNTEQQIQKTIWQLKLDLW